MVKSLKFAISLIAFQIAFGTILSASEICTVKEVTGSAVDKRSKQITFPDGRQLIVLGHNHGDRMFPLKVNKLLKDETQSNTQFLEYFKYLALEGAATSKHAIEDLHYLQKLLTENDKVNFVAIEGTHETVVGNYEYFKLLQQRLLDQIKKRSLSQTLQINETVLVATGAVNYLKFRNSELFSKRELIGLESEDASNQHDLALEKFDAARDELQGAVSDPEFLRRIKDTYPELMALYPKYESGKHDQILLEEVIKFSPPEYKELVVKWMHSAIAEMQAMQRRDQAVALGLVNRNQSGILFVGLWHLDYLAELLKKHCDKENGIKPNRNGGPSIVNQSVAR